MLLKKRLINKSFKVCEIIYIFSYSIYLIVSILNLSLYATLLPAIATHIIMLMCIGLLFIIELLQKSISKKNIIFLLIAFTMAIILYSKNYLIAVMFLFYIGARNIKIDSFLRVTVVVSSAVLLFVVLSSQLGIIKDYICISDTTNRTRHFLGFTYVLFPSGILFNITIAYVYLKRLELSIKHYIIVLFVNILMFDLTQARLNFILCLIVVMLCITKNIVFKSCIVKYGFAFSFVLCMITSYVLIISYSPSRTLLNKLNIMLEDRLYLGHEGFNNYNILPFGQTVFFNGYGLSAAGDQIISGKYNYVDNYYENILLRFGFVFLVLIILWYTYAGIIAVRRKDYICLIAIAAFAIHGMVDDLIVNLYYNCLGIMAGRIILGDYNENRERLQQVIIKMLGRNTALSVKKRME